MGIPDLGDVAGLRVRRRRSPRWPPFTRLICTGNQVLRNGKYNTNSLVGLIDSTFQFASEKKNFNDHGEDARIPMEGLLSEHGCFSQMLREV
jgi:hypothetical protein